MELALEQAEMAAREGEVPVGAVAVLEGRVLAADHNRSIQLSDPSAHAEILVLRKAGSILANYRLPGAELYATLEPCPMCAGALIWARITRIVFATRDEKAGGIVSRASILTPGVFNHNVEFIEGLLAERSRDILQKFFAARRGKSDSAAHSSSNSGRAGD